MFNSPVIDLVILLSFTYFVGSLIISAINESISGAFRLRQKWLQRAIERMFFDDKWRGFVEKNLITSPHIQSLMRGTRRYPAYIPSKNFVLAVIQHLGPDFPKDMLRHIDQSNLPPDFKQVLKDFVTDSENNFEKFKANIEAFYNSVMDRAAGWYKKQIRLVLLVIGIGLSVFLNLDTIKIANDALKDKGRLAETANNISQLIPRISADTVGTIVIRDEAGNVIFEQSIRSSALDTTRVRSEYESVKELTMEYTILTGYRLGYADWDDFKKQWFGIDQKRKNEQQNTASSEGNNSAVMQFLLKAFGVTITAFALLMSANYWFDLMNKVANIRAVGRRPNGDPKVSSH